MVALKPERLSLKDCSDQPISMVGKVFLAHKTGALYWPAERALIVADLHFEKGSSYASRGQMLPPYDTRETIAKLASVIDVYDPETVISLGDCLHDTAAASRLADSDLTSLLMLQSGRDWIWITGNHDPIIDKCLGGYAMPELSVEGITLRHQPQGGAVTHEIAAHMHPAARLVHNGASLRRPCFVSNGLRLILPAFGAFTGGLNILDRAYEPFFGMDGLRVWMLGQEGLYPVAPRLLRSD